MTKINLSDKQKNALKAIIDKECGRITTSADYYTGGPIEELISEKTGERLSGSTVKRIVGLAPGENRPMSETSQRIISKLLDFKSAEQLIKHLERVESHNLYSIEEFTPTLFLQSHQIKVEIEGQRKLLLRLKQGNIFEILEAENCALLNGDKLVVLKLQLGQELICHQVERKIENSMTNLGAYTSGNNKIVSIVFER